MAAGDHELLEHYYAKIENNNRFHCYERKDASACHELADFIETRKKKFAEALEIYKTNCKENNYGKSCFAYAQMLFHGKKGVEKDLKEATKAYVKGCDAKRYSAAACCTVGLLLLKENNPPEVKSVIGSRNVKKAGKMFARGCEQYDKISCSYAAQFYNENIAGHSTADAKLAFKYAVSACELNSGVGCSIAAKACQEGVGTEKNEQLFEYYDKRAKALNVKKTRHVGKMD